MNKFVVFMDKDETNNLIVVEVMADHFEIAEDGDEEILVFYDKNENRIGIFDWNYIVGVSRAYDEAPKPVYLLGQGEYNA